MIIYFTCPKKTDNSLGFPMDTLDIPHFDETQKMRCARYMTGFVAGVIAPDSVCADILAADGVTERTEAFAVTILGGPV